LPAAGGLPQVRLNFLSQLLPEAFAHLHMHLCASVLGRKLLQLPFNRDLELDLAGARAMRAAVEHCRRVGQLLRAVQCVQGDLSALD
jgi:hypothetical protein